jgi:hypothetical protein
MGDKLDEVVAALYDAALEPEGWSMLGPQLCALFDATSFLLVVQKRSDRQIELLETNWSARTLSDYASHFYAIDCWMEEGSSSRR